MNTIGIIGAMEQEIAYIKSAMDIVSVDKIAGLDFYVGKLHEKNTILVRCGIGKVNAAVCSQALIDAYKPDCVINTGAAGAISKDLDIGDIVISDELVMHDFDITHIMPGYNGQEKYMKADSKLIEIAASEATFLYEKGVKVYVGRIATGDFFVCESETKEKIWSDYQALCVEMEGAAVAQACQMNNVPFLIVRAVSDKADEEAGMSLDEFVTSAAENSCEIIKRMAKGL